MGTTKTALQAGSLGRSWIALIEGYDRPLSNSTEAKVQAALTGTDWASSTVVTGLTVELQNEQRLDPWQPFHGGGKLSLVVKDSIADQTGSEDTFGIEVHRKTAGDETTLTAAVDSNDTTLTVASTTSFASSGEVHVGTECIAYASTTATTFASCTRGKYSPFGVDGGTRFGRPHRVRNDPNNVTLRPLVTEQPRHWVGRMVGLWMHRESGGVLDTKAEAQLVFAGRIVEIRDDPETMSTIVECEHILDSIADATLGREMWSGKFEGGIVLTTNDTFEFLDTDDKATSAYGAATDLAVVASGASGAFQVNAGAITAERLLVVLNEWLSAAKQAAEIEGRYNLSIVGAGTDQARTRLLWQIDQPGVSTTIAYWQFSMSTRVAEFLGFKSQGVAFQNGFRMFIESEAQSSDSIVREFVSNDIPYRSLIDLKGIVSEGPFDLLEEQGSFSDQQATLPVPISAPVVADHSWGVILVDDKWLLRVARKTDGTLRFLKDAAAYYPLAWYGTPALVRLFSEPAEFSARQVFVIEGTFTLLLKQLFYSTGTAGYNHSTYDALPFGLGMAVPGALLGDTFEATCDQLAGANMGQLMILDKPTPVAEMFTGDLVTRWAFPRWKDQILQIATWPTPVAGTSVATLTEATKAAPAGQDDNHRTASVFNDQWQRPIVKWRYERDYSEIGNDQYFSSVTFEDPAAIDDCGGVGRPVTIKFPNLFGTAKQLGPGIDQLAQTFKGPLPMFTRGSRVVTRSIDARYWETIAVGDVVVLQDEFARDPDTGVRGTSRPGVIVGHRWQPGGGIPGQAVEMSGEVDVMFLELGRFGQYVPTAQVDEGQTDAGYNAGTKTLTCYAHAHSESSEAADATYFPAGSKVRIVEIDPSSPASPQSWDDTVASQTGNTITLTTGLAGWDTSKRYRVISDDYADASTTQQGTYCYQADDSDGLVANLRLPYQYTINIFDTTTVTANSTSDQLELPPNGSYGDGVGRDVGSEAALTRLAANVIDYKTAHSSPKMSNTTMTGSGLSGTWKLVEIRPVFVSGDVLTTSVTRNISVSTWFRSSDGASASVRITLAKSMPGDASVEDVDRGQVYDDVTFTTTSTTWAAATADDLSAAVKDIDGIAFLLVECSVKAETRGAVKFQVGPRSYA